MRVSGVLRPDSCAKNRLATIWPAQTFAALPSLPFECTAGRPLAARSAFSRQRIAADIAFRFDGAGSAEVLEQATPPATPCDSASVGRFSFGEIGTVFPVVLDPC